MQTFFANMSFDSLQAPVQKIAFQRAFVPTRLLRLLIEPNFSEPLGGLYREVRDSRRTHLFRWSIFHRRQAMYHRPTNLFKRVMD